MLDNATVSFFGDAIVSISKTGVSEKFFAEKRKVVLLMETSKKHHCHAELVSASPNLQEIAGQARNDRNLKIGFLEIPLYLMLTSDKR